MTTRFRCLFDEDFNNRVIRGLQQRLPEWDALRVQDAELAGTDDPAVLEFAAAAGRIVLTHDEATMPNHAYDRLARSQPLPGVFVVPQDLPIGRAVEEIMLVRVCSEPEEWNGQVRYLPLK